jgi:hypothetical protein
VAQLNDSVFPTQIDNVTLVEWVDGITEGRADFLNTLRSAIVNIEKVLGANTPETYGYDAGDIHSSLIDAYGGAPHRDSVSQHIGKTGGTTNIATLYNPHRIAAEDIESGTTVGYAGTAPQTVQKHIDTVGNGTVKATNPHGLDVRDIPTSIGGVDHYMVTSGLSSYAGANNLKMISNTATFDADGELTVTSVGLQTLEDLFPTSVLFAKGNTSTVGGVVNEEVVDTHTVKFQGFVFNRFLPTSRMTSQSFSYMIIGY